MRRLPTIKPERCLLSKISVKISLAVFTKSAVAIKVRIKATTIDKNNKKNPYRKSNALKWANIASCNLYALYDFSDQRLDAIPQLDMVKKLEQAIETLKPNILYIHHPGDMNSDHQIAAQVALATTQAGLATTNGAAQVTLATAQVGLATTQAANALASATDSSNSAASALTHKNNASSSASGAATSATNSANSATASAASASISEGVAVSMSIALG